MDISAEMQRIRERAERDRREGQHAAEAALALAAYNAERAEQPQWCATLRTIIAELSRLGWSPISITRDEFCRPIPNDWRCFVPNEAAIDIAARAIVIVEEQWLAADRPNDLARWVMFSAHPALKVSPPSTLNPANAQRVADVAEVLRYYSVPGRHVGFGQGAASRERPAPLEEITK